MSVPTAGSVSNNEGLNMKKCVRKDKMLPGSAGKRVRDSSAIPVEVLKALESSPAAMSGLGWSRGEV